EHAREGEHVVDLVGEVAAPGGDHLGMLDRLGGVDLRGRVRHREHDGAVRHGGDVLGGQDVPGADADEHVSSRDRVGQGAGDAAGVGDLRDPGQAPLELLAVLMDDAVDVGDDHVPGAGGAQQAQDRGAGGPRAGQDDAGGRDLLLDDAQGVPQRGDDNDRGAVLVVVEDGDVELGAQAVLDLEAAGRGDVLEVDAGEDRGDRL